MSKEKVFLDPSNAEKILANIYTELNAKVNRDNIPGATNSSIGGIKSGGNIEVNPDDGTVTVKYANVASKLYKWSSSYPGTTLGRRCKVASIKLPNVWADYHAVICANECNVNGGNVIFSWDCATSNIASSIDKNRIIYIAGSGDVIRLYKDTFYTEAIVEDDGVLFNLWCEPKAIHQFFAFTLLNESKAYINYSLTRYDNSEFTTEPLTGHVNHYTENDWYGNASTATKLTTNAGSATQPVYFSDGVPKATSYTLGKSVPSDAKFTDTTYSNATANAAGLMSEADKIKLDDIASEIDNCLKRVSVAYVSPDSSGEILRVNFGPPFPLFFITYVLQMGGSTKTGVWLELTDGGSHFKTYKLTGTASTSNPEFSVTVKNNAGSAPTYIVNYVNSKANPMCVEVYQFL